MTKRSQSSLSFHPVTQAIGAEVRGIDLRGGVSGDLAAALRAGLCPYHVLFVRGQHLDDSAHRELAVAFGEPTVHPFERPY